jgi:hypothetical protein
LDAALHTHNSNLPPRRTNFEKLTFSKRLCRASYFKTSLFVITSGYLPDIMGEDPKKTRGVSHYVALPIYNFKKYLKAKEDL